MRGRKTRGKSKSAPPSAEQAVGKRAQVPSPAGGYASVLHQDLRHYPQAPLRWAGDESWMTKSQVLLCHQAALKENAFDIAYLSFLTVAPCPKARQQRFARRSRACASPRPRAAADRRRVCIATPYDLRSIRRWLLAA